MNILLVRHAIAEDRAEFAQRNPDDDLRPLTAKGEERMQAAGSGLRLIAPAIDLLAHSPLTRARQTAVILQPILQPCQVMEIPDLAPLHGPALVTAWLARQKPELGVCLVGHEPDLSELVAWLTAGKVDGFIQLKKGSACLLACPNDQPPGPANCRLIWALSPRQLRMLSHQPA